MLATPILAKSCIPMDGDLPRYNPYHSELIGRTMGPVMGTGVPIKLMDPFKASQNFAMTFSISSHVSVESSFQVSLGKSLQNGIISEKGKATTTRTADTKTMSKGFDKIISKMKQTGRSEEDSKAYEKVSREENTKIETERRRKEVTDSIRMTWDERSKTCTGTAESVTVSSSINGEVKSPFTSISTTVSGSSTASVTAETCNEQGKSKAIEQLIAQSTETEASKSHTTSKEQRESNANSKTNSELNEEAQNEAEHNSENVSNANEVADNAHEVQKKQKESVESKTDSSGTVKRKTTTITQEFSNYPVFQGHCYVAVCEPTVHAVLTPMLCPTASNVDELGVWRTMFPTGVPDRSADTNIESSTPSIVPDKPECTTSIIHCDEYKTRQFSVSDDIYHSRTSHNSLSYGDVLKPGEWLTGFIRKGDLTAADGTFSFVLEQNGNLIVKHNWVKVWETGITYLSDYEHEVAINKIGHLVHRAKGILNNDKPDEWSTVWSTVPEKYSDMVVGIPGKPIGYTLVFHDSVLYMYDSQGIRIWCGNSNSCVNGNGFVHPQNYLYSHKLGLTVTNGDKYNDPHNDFNARIREREVDQTGIFLRSGEFIESANRMFKLVLDETGNLSVKQGHLTIWESKSGYVRIITTNDRGPYNEKTKRHDIKTIVSDSVGPYSLIVCKSNRLCIVDMDHYVIWMTQTFEQKNLDIGIHDDGYLYIRADSNVLWTNINNQNTARVNTDSILNLDGAIENESYYTPFEPKPISAERKCTQMESKYDMLYNPSQQSSRRIHDVWNNLKCFCYALATSDNLKPFGAPQKGNYGSHKVWNADRCSCIVAQNKYNLFNKNSYGNTIFGKEVPKNVKNGWIVNDCDEYVSDIKYDGFL